MKIRIIAIALFLLTGTLVEAQTVTGDRFRFTTGCALRSGAGSPEGAQTAPPCTYWVQTDAPYHLWRKASGSGNTGWAIVSSGGTVTSVALTTPTGLTVAGSPITTSGTFALSLQSGYTIPGGGNAGDWFKSNGASAPSFVAPAALTRVDDTNITLTLGGAASTALLNATSITAGWTGTLAASRLNANVVQAITNDTNVTGSIASQTLTLGWTGVCAVTRGCTGAGTWATNGVLYGQGTSALAITAQGGTNTVLVANNGAPSFSATPTVTSIATTGSATIGNLTSGRVAIIGTGGLLADDADLAFATDTLTATKAVTPTSMTTPVVYGYGATKTLSLGGTGILGCPTNAPTTDNCEAGILTFTSAMFEQQLATNNTYRTQWFVNTDGGMLRSYTTNAYIPMNIEGGPVRLRGGGVHIGGTAGVSDPGVGNTFVDGWLRSTNPVYASQTTGMSVDFSNGSIDTRYLFAEEMHVKNFIADLEQALAGSQIISKSVAVLASDFTVPAGGSISTMTLRDLPSAPNMAVFEANDHVRLRTFSRAAGSLTVTDAYGVVTGYADGAVAGTQTWTFTRSLSPCSGAATTGAVIAADSLVLDYGVSGNGFIETSAIDGLYGVNSPYTQAVTWSGCVSTQTVRTRVGNLRGIGAGAFGYGLFAGSYENSQYAVFSDQLVELHGVPLKLYNATTPVIELEPATPSFKMGTNTSSISASAGVGAWSGLTGGCFLWRVGDPAAQNISFNSCTGVLALTGAITVSGTLPDANNALALVGTAGATVVNGAALATTGLTASGNPKLPAVATPSGCGLFMGSDYTGYYCSGAWKTFIQNNGNFYLGGTGGNLQWVAATSTLVISATLSGNGSGVTAINGGNITTGTVTATQILANTITAGQIAADTITAGQIAANAITTVELNADSVTSAKIVAGTIVASDIAAGTITANEITAGTITAALIAAGTITATQIASNTITATQIAAGTITTTQLNFTPATSTNVIATINASAEGIDITADRISISGTTTFSAGYDPTGKIAATGAAADINANVTTISGGKITTGSITAAQITAGTITATELAADSVTSAKIVAGTIVAADIAAGTITANEITVSTLSSLSANLGAVTAGSIIVVNGANTVGVSPSAANAFYSGPTGTPTFYVTPAGALTATNALITSASGTVTLGTGGISLGTPGTSASSLYSYRGESSFTGTNLFGSYFFEASSTSRSLSIANTTTAASKTTGVILNATSAAKIADISLVAATVSTVDISADEVTATAVTHFEVSAPNFTVTPAGTLINSSAVIHAAKLSPTQLTVSVNDYNPTGLGTARYLRLSASGAVNITGLFNLTDGTELILWNGGAATITLKQEDGASIAANRFVCPGAVDFALTQYKGVLVRYDSTTGRWIIVG